MVSRVLCRFYSCGNRTAGVAKHQLMETSKGKPKHQLHLGGCPCVTTGFLQLCKHEPTRTVSEVFSSTLIHRLASLVTS